MTDWKSALSEEVQQFWKSRRKALLLAQVPPRLRSMGILLSRELGDRKLREAISVDAADVVRLVQNPNDPLVWGVIPADADWNRP